jgi:hypothetical protein
MHFNKAERFIFIFGVSFLTTKYFKQADSIMMKNSNNLKRTN